MQWLFEHFNFYCTIGIFLIFVIAPFLLLVFLKRSDNNDGDEDKRS